MKRFAFISRHSITECQQALAADQEIELIPVGDTDAFTVTPQWVRSHGEFEGVVIVHPAAAMRLSAEFIIGVFENSNRAPEGERPKFEAKALCVFDHRDLQG